MRASFEEYNINTSDEVRAESVLLSMDIKALYPSMRDEVIVRAVRELILESDLKAVSVEYLEVGKYLRVVLSSEEIGDHGLTDVLPRRSKMSRRKLTTNCLDDGNWVPAKDRPDDQQRKLMLALAVSEGVRTVVGNHTYMVGDQIYLQTTGSPIGLDISSPISRAVMMLFDKLFLKKLREEGMTVSQYKRYVDDINTIIKGLEGQSTSDLVLRLKEIADSVLEGIEVEIDLPENHPDGKLPILDMKSWLDPSGNILYQHYEKSMASKQVISARSAHSESSKRAVHISECVRRMVNTSRRLDWTEYFVPALTNYMERMKKAGYRETYRRRVIMAALKVYDSKQKKDLADETPLNRPSGYKKVERRREKRRKKKDWAGKEYIAPIIVPATPNSELAKELQRVADEESDGKIRLKVVERGGKSVENHLVNVNPTGSDECGDEKCPFCAQPGGAGGGKICHKNKILYEAKCLKCPDSKYVGESDRNLFTRGKEHLKNKSGFIVKHQEEKHNSEPAEFEWRVLRTFRDPLSRQTAEAVSIRRHQGELLNSKAEFHQPPLVQVRSEVVRGIA